MTGDCDADEINLVQLIDVLLCLVQYICRLHLNSLHRKANRYKVSKKRCAKRDSDLHDIFRIH